MNYRKIVLGLALCLLSLVSHAASKAQLQIVLVVDGLRPDSITETNTPNLYKLQKQGVWFDNTHAVFPTVTRVNSASFSTGTYPARHGVMGNNMFVSAVDATAAFGNDDFKNLLKLDAATAGQMLTVPGLAEIFKARDKKFVVLSSGSTGSAMLLAPKATRGIGTLINPDFYPGEKIAYPDTVSRAILEKFPLAPKKGGAKARYDESVDWSMQVLRDYVLPTLKPDVLFVWMTEPDHIQHGIGIGGKEALAAIHNDDRQIGLLLQKLQALGLGDKTNLIVVSDHGFSQTVADINIERFLIDANLMSATKSGDVVIASSGQSVALHVKDHDPSQIAAIVKALQAQPWCGVVFTRGSERRAAHEGTVDGTFALELAQLGGHERSPDIVFTFPWSSIANADGVPGGDYNVVSGNGVSGPVSNGTANHGGIGPWTIRNTMLANGPDFKRGAIVRTSSSNVDVAPTLMHLMGFNDVLRTMDGRPLIEAFVDGPDQEQVSQEVRTHRVSSGAYAAALQESSVAGKRYLDKGWRER